MMSSAGWVSWTRSRQDQTVASGQPLCNPRGNLHHRSAPKLAIRPIHKLAVIVPVDYQFEEDRTTDQIERRGDTKQEATKKNSEGREYNPGSGRVVKIADPRERPLRKRWML